MNAEASGGSQRISLKRAAKLQRKKYREAERLFLAEGQTLVKESPRSPRWIFKETDEIRRLSTLTTPTGPVGVFSFLDVSDVEVMDHRDRVVLLHGVQDPGNIGTIVRAAHAFGAGVALSEGCADLYNPKTVRATMGSIFHAPVVREVQSVEFLRSARESGFEAIAAVPGGGRPPGEVPAGKSVVVIGSEGAGLPEEVIASCHHRAEIPSLAASLNAAMAASILLYEAYIRVLT